MARMGRTTAELVLTGEEREVLVRWHPHSDGRAYYKRKVAEGKTRKEALRCLKRRISDAVYARLQADAQPAARCDDRPGRATGERL